MAVLLRHLTEGVEGSPDRGDKFRQRRESKIVRCQPRRQQESQIRRRNSMRDPRSVFLNDIRDQPVLFGGAVLAEETPGSQRSLAEHRLIAPRDAAVLRAARFVDPARDRP